MASDARTDFEALTREQVKYARSDEAFQQRIAAAQDRFRPLLEALEHRPSIPIIRHGSSWHYGSKEALDE